THPVEWLQKMSRILPMATGSCFCKGGGAKCPIRHARPGQLSESDLGGPYPDRRPPISKFQAAPPDRCSASSAPRRLRSASARSPGAGAAELPSTASSPSACEAGRSKRREGRGEG